MARKTYTSDDIDVTFDLKICVHSAKCLRGLPQVFDTSARPWAQPWQASADEVAAVIHTCPSGALQYHRKDGAPDEPIPDQNTISIRSDGPYYFRGDLRLHVGDQVLEMTRLALCRCGSSQNKPFCDNSHRTSGFTDAGDSPDNSQRKGDAPTGGPLEIIPEENGPLILDGNFEIISADKQAVFRGKRAFLCRCGHSESKPFCDHTHARIGFVAEGEAPD
ncbi:MAG: CDGSH iron-sulfur domain-containing protein [Caldilineales bacterium]|nr:CDGSH iron-sulfur domain-containing protein [Caldilineales bacterium]